MESGVIQETGQKVKYFDTKDELFSAITEGKIYDGDLVALQESAGFESGKNYGFLFGSTTNEINIVYPTHYYSLGLTPMSWHDLPDPGWVVDNINQVIISPEGEKFPIGEITTALLLLVFVIAATIVISLALIYAIVFQITYQRIAQSSQITNDLVSVTAPSGEAFIFDKNTGEQKGHALPPSNDWTWIIILAGGLIALYFLTPLLSRLGGSEEGGEWSHRIYEPEERWGRPEPEERPARGYLFGKRVGKALRRTGRGAKETARGIWHGIKEG